MRPTIHILHLEDDPTDARLVRDSLRAEGLPIEVTVVANSADFVAALDRGAFDVILSDYMLPGFDGISALALAHNRCPATPFIFVSGVLGEERAIETLRRGATDYVMKTRLTRLVSAVRRAVAEREEHNRRQEAEQKLARAHHQLQSANEQLGRRVQALTAELDASSNRIHQAIEERKEAQAALDACERRWRCLVDSNVIGVAISAPDGTIVEANDNFLELIGYTRRDLRERQLNWVALTPRRFAEADAKARASLKKDGTCPPYEKEVLTKSGRNIPVLIGAGVFQAAGIEPQMIASVVDLTEG